MSEHIGTKVEASELLEWRDHDSNSEITYTGFGPYMVEKLDAESFRIWLPDDTKTARIMVGGFTSRKDARAACQSNADSQRGVFRAISGDAVSLEAALGREESSAEYWWARAKDAEAAVKPFSTYPEQRSKMLALCASVEQTCDDDAAVELADLVKGILEDETFASPSFRLPPLPSQEG